MLGIDSKFLIFKTSSFFSIFHAPADAPAPVDGPTSAKKKNKFEDPEGPNFQFPDFGTTGNTGSLNDDNSSILKLAGDPRKKRRSKTSKHFYFGGATY